MPKLLYQGHGSVRLTSDNGLVIYVDPYAGQGYDVPADLILVSHQHGDHNQIVLPAKKQDCRIISNREALTDGKYQSFNISGIEIKAVEAANKNHNRGECVGFLVTLDGFKLYFTGDTSRTESMGLLSPLGLDYALFCCDGHYNMGPDEAAECAKIIGAKHNIPVHMKPGALFDREAAERFNAPNRLILADGEEIELMR